MTTENKELLIKAEKLNSAVGITIEGVEYKLVAKHDDPVKPTGKAEGKVIEAVRTIKDKIQFEGFNGTVHLYLLKDELGKEVKNYIWNDKAGKEKTLVPEKGEKLYCLDFRNQSGSAIAAWKCEFISDDLNLAQDNLVNALLGSKKDNRYVLSSVTANARIADGDTLSHKIIFAAKGSIPVAHDFKLFAVDLNAKVPAVGNFKSDGKYDFNEYKKALELAPLFFEANESGKRSPGNRVKWRYADAFMQDGQDVGKDLSGGIWDAGDHLLAAHPLGYSFATVAFTMHKYEDIFRKTGQWEHYKNSLTHVCNWLMKIHEYKNNETVRLYHWIPLSSYTHSEWTIPEKSKHKRNTYVIDKNNRGSEPVHNTGSALAFAYLVYEKDDPSYAKKCLENSISLYNFGVKYPGKYKSQTVYASSSGFYDERCHHAVSLFAATGDRKYLNDANKVFKEKIGQALGWFNHLDNSSYMSLLLLSIYDGGDHYHNNIKWLADAWVNGKNGVKTIDGKLRCVNQWATCSQGTGMSGLFAAYSHFSRKNESFESFNRSQLNYTLGENVDNYSYLIGFGDKWLKSPHHRGSAGGVQMHEPGANKNTLIGALIGGKKLDHSFPATDQASRSDWISAEVATNYNANFILCNAGALKTVM